MYQRRRLVFKVVGTLTAAVCMVLAAGCSSTSGTVDGESSGSGAPPQLSSGTESSISTDDSNVGRESEISPGAPVASGPITLDIGMIAGITGRSTDLGRDQSDGARLAAKQLNETKPFGDIQINLTVENSESDTDQAIAKYKELVTGGVDAMMGGSSSNTALAVEEFAQKDGVVFLSLTASSEQVEPIKPYVFVGPETVTQMDRGLVRYFAANNLKNIAIVYQNDQSYGQTGRNELVKQGEAAGLTITVEEAVTTGTTNFATNLTHLRAVESDVVVFWGIGPGATAFAKQYREAGIDAELAFGGAQASALFVEGAGDAAENALAVGDVGIVPSLAATPEVQSLGEQFAKDFQAAYGRSVSEVAAAGYSAVMLLAKAASVAQSADRAAIRDGLERFELGTPAGHYAYTPDNHTVDDSAAVVMRVINGVLSAP